MYLSFQSGLLISAKLLLVPLFLQLCVLAAFAAVASTSAMAVGGSLEMEDSGIDRRSVRQMQKLAILAKRTGFLGLECRGMYKQSFLAQLERICEDCYNLYKDPEVHGYCRLIHVPTY